MEENKTVVYDGIKFYLTKQGYYLSGNTNAATIRLHVYVWEKHNGKVPKGCHVHHIDMDKSNNDISNLQLMTQSEHMSYHNQFTDKEKRIENLNKYARPKASEWHGSKEGVEWHKRHYEEVKDKFHSKIEITCLHCGRKVMVVNNGRNKYCSDKCKSAHRTRKKSDFEDRKCVVCGKIFSTNKYGKVKNCSTECAVISSNLKKRAKRESKANN